MALLVLGVNIGFPVFIVEFTDNSVTVSSPCCGLGVEGSRPPLGRVEGEPSGSTLMLVAEE